MQFSKILVIRNRKIPFRADVSKKTNRNEAKKRKEAKNYVVCFAKRIEKTAKRFPFRFISLRSKKKIVAGR